MTSYNLSIDAIHKYRIIKHFENKSNSEVIGRILEYTTTGEIQGDTEIKAFKLTSEVLGSLENHAVSQDTTRGMALSRLISGYFECKIPDYYITLDDKYDIFDTLENLMTYRYVELPLSAKTLSELGKRREELNEFIKAAISLFECLEACYE